IYNELEISLGSKGSSQALKYELEIEKKFTVFNPFIKKIYEYAVNSNKSIIFITDMYLTEQFISKILAENGYTQYDGLYVSGSIGLSKASSNLFDYVREKKRIRDKWLHIGDNYISDYKNALSKGIEAYHYKSLRSRAGITKEASNYQYSILKAIQINYCET